MIIDELPIESATLYSRSDDGTYAVGFIQIGVCNYGFHLDGQLYDICTASGDWEQVRNHSRKEGLYPPNNPRKCRQGNANNVFSNYRSGIVNSKSSVGKVLL